MQEINIRVKQQEEVLADLRSHFYFSDSFQLYEIIPKSCARDFSQFDAKQWFRGINAHVK